MLKTNVEINNRINCGSDRYPPLPPFFQEVTQNWQLIHLSKSNCPFFCDGPRTHHIVQHLSDGRVEGTAHIYLPTEKHISAPWTSVLRHHWKRGNYAWQKTINKSFSAGCSCGLMWRDGGKTELKYRWGKGEKRAGPVDCAMLRWPVNVGIFISKAPRKGRNQTSAWMLWVMKRTSEWAKEAAWERIR